MTVATTLSLKTERGVQASHPPWLIPSQRIQNQWRGSAFWLLVQPFAYYRAETAEIRQEPAVSKVLKYQPAYPAFPSKKLLVPIQENPEG